jgi:hypothetical protein
MISKSSFSFLGILLVLVIGSFQVVFAQSETATISGTVVDPNNAVVPGATVTVRSTRTGFSRTTTTNQEGYYVITNLQPSTYEITISSGDFQEFKVTRDIGVAADAVVNATLQATGIQTQVTVQAGASDVAEVNVTDQVVSEVVTNKQIESLPTITRDPYGFIVTVGNVQTAESGGRGVGANINGQRAASTNILINGGENVDVFTASAGQSVPLDSVQEFRVTTGTFTAELGRATGGVVNLVTKSGQNRFFGSLYAFNRNSEFASAGFDANARAVPGVAPRQFFNRNQFGGSLGGPIIKDRLLFFTNTELTRIRSSANIFALVPSEASIAAAAPATRAFFAGYTLNARPTGRTQSLTSTSGRVLTFNEVQYTVPANTGAGTPEDGVQSANRIDWNVSDRLQIYGVYALEKRTFLEGSNANSPYTGFSTGAETDNTNMQIAGTYQLTDNLIGVSRFTYNKLDQSQPLGEQPDGPTLYLRTSAQSIGGVRIAFPGYLPFNPGSAIPFGGPQTVYNAAQEFSYNIGNHLLRFGGQFYRIHDDRVFGAFQNAVQTLSLTSNADAVENFFNGRVAQFQGASNPNGRFPGQTVTLPVSSPNFGRNNRYTEYNIYGQDSFRWFPGFTVNIGLRYEYFGPQRNADPNLDSNFYLGGDGSVTPANIRSGTVQLAPNSPVGELWEADKNNFAPSVGFAYDITGDGKTSLRAGYALRYERNFGNVTFNVIQNPPNYAVVSIQPQDVGGPIAITRNNAGPLAGNTGSVILPRVSLRGVNPNIVNAYAHQYSASLERRFGQVTASAVFSGTSGRDLYTITDVNRLFSGTTYLGSTAGCPGTPLAPVDRLNGCYTGINFRTNGGRSDYQGITFSLESGNLFGAGLTMATRYTYAVARDNLSSTFSETGNQFALGLTDPFNPLLDYGFADFDVRHRFVSNFVWDLPTKKYFSSGIGRALFGDFTVSGIIQAQTGTPFTIYDCSDAINVCKRLIPNGPIDFNGGELGNSVGTNEFQWLRYNGQPVFIGFAQANNGGPYPENMTPRNAFRGPGFWNVDMALMKRFFFTERANLALRVDAVNVFNNATPVLNGFGPGVDISNNDPVVTVSKFGRRQLQFGLRFEF